MRRHGLIVMVSGCLAIVGASACVGGAPKPAAVPNNPSIITEAELAAATPEGNAYDFIRRVRPAWFASRGAVTFNANRGQPGLMHVSLEGGTLQDIELLTRMRATELREVQFLNATDATQRFGAGTSSGAVILVMQR